MERLAWLSTLIQFFESPARGMNRNSGYRLRLRVGQPQQKQLAQLSTKSRARERHAGRRKTTGAAGVAKLASQRSIVELVDNTGRRIVGQHGVRAKLVAPRV